MEDSLSGMSGEGDESVSTMSYWCSSRISTQPRRSERRLEESQQRIYGAHNTFEGAYHSRFSNKIDKIISKEVSP